MARRGPGGTYLGRVSWLPVYGVIIRILLAGTSAEGQDEVEEATMRGTAPGPTRLAR